MKETTICALSTASGGAIAVIRVSGPDAISIVDKHFRSVKSGRTLAEAKGQTLHYGQFMAGRDTQAHAVDDVLVSIFRAPHSYTGEDSAEISCHASAYIISTLLQTLIDSGCQQAQPGEFTQRAFMNGKMDLSQAEAVADLIASTNAATHRVAMSQLRGNFSSELALLREQLLRLTALMELELDFSDHEDLEFADRSELITLTQTISDKVHKLAESFKTGKALKHGVPVAIVGKTNVGKSTLLNRLLHEDKAIVSNIHGTTRDAIEDTINIRGIDFRFIDTAGFRDTPDEIERIGIERTVKKMEEAAIIIHLTDNPKDLQLPYNFPTNCNVIHVCNKVDLYTPTTTDFYISAKENIGIEALEEALVEAAGIPEIGENDVIVTSARHYEALLKASEALRRVGEGLHTNLPTDLLAEDLRESISHLGEIVGGTISSDETLHSIFSSFCIGK